MNRVAALKTHSLPETAFAALTAGGRDSDVICLLCEAQRSKHTMLLHVIAGATGDADPAEPAIAAFRVGYELLTRVQVADPADFTWLLGPPHLGGWANDGLICLDQSTSPDFAYLASLTAEGERFTELVRALGERFGDEPAPDDTLWIARKASLDHWLTWQIQHVAVDEPGEASPADAYRASEPDPAPDGLPSIWITEDVRKLGASVRGRLLNMRYLKPAWYRELLDGGTLPLTEPDHLQLLAHAKLDFPPFIIRIRRWM